jgi:hypothetical protein
MFAGDSADMCAGKFPLVLNSDTRLVKIWWINLVTNPFLTFLANSIFQSGEIHPCVLSGDQDFNLVITGSIW